MMAKVYTKGQITLPARLREKLNLMPGDEVKLSLEQGSIRLIPCKTSGLMDLAGVIKAKGKTLDRVQAKHTASSAAIERHIRVGENNEAD